MADIRGVGTAITYSDDNPVGQWMERLRAERDKLKREPRDAEERRLLGRWLGYRGRDELESIVGSACYAFSHITTPKVLDFEDRVVHAEERGHHDAALQKLHDYVWALVERYGEAPIKRRVAEIDAAALNAGSRICFDPPRRDFLRKYYDVPLENAGKFFEWRRYLYTNVLGWEPELIAIRDWPKEIPVPEQLAA